MKLRIKAPQYNTAFYAILLPPETKMRLAELKTFYNIDVPEEIRNMLKLWLDKIDDEMRGTNDK